MLQILIPFNLGSLFFLMFFLITKKDRENKFGNFWFIVFFITLIGPFLVGSMRDFKVHILYPHLYKLGDLNAFTIAPTLFLAIKYFTTPLSRIKKTDWLHFIPTLIYIGLNINYLFRSSEALALMIQSLPRNRELFKVLEVLLVLQCLIYLFLALHRLTKYQKNIILYDASNKNDLQWLRYFLYGIAVMLLVWIVNLKGYIGNYIYLGYSFCIYYLGYFVINQSDVFPYSETNKNELNSFIQNLKDLNDRKSPMLSNELLEYEKEKLISTMINVKPFLDNELTLVKLAQIQKLSIRELSYIINQGFGDNFNQFINKYRIEESKLMLANPNFNNLNMVGIAYQSGFNSKTIFNTTFKKMIGQTPSEYRNNNQKDVRNHKSEQL